MATAFGDLLHRAGVPMSADRLRRFVRATALTAPATLDDLYWVGRVTLLVDRSHVDTCTPRPEGSGLQLRHPADKTHSRAFDH